MGSYFVMCDNTSKCVTEVRKNLKDRDVFWKFYFVVLTTSWFQSDAAFQFNKYVKGRQLSYSKNLDN